MKLGTFINKYGVNDRFLKDSINVFIYSDVAE